MPTISSGGLFPTGATLPLNNNLWALARAQSLAHPSYRRRFAEWTMCRDCFEGQTSIKDRSVIYLPPKKNMDDKGYVFFLTKARFFNATGRTISDLMTRVFRRPAYFKVPSKVSTDALFRDGRSFARAQRTATQEVLIVNHYGLLLDLPGKDTTTVEPFLTEYKAEDILSWIPGKTVDPFTGNLVHGPVAILLEENVLCSDTDTAGPTSDATANGPLTPSTTNPANIPQSGGVSTTDSHYGTTGEANLWNGITARRFRLLALDNNGEYYQFVGNQGFFENMRSLPHITEPPSALTYPNIRGKRLRYIPFHVFNTDNGSMTPPKPIVLDIVHLNLAHYQDTAALAMSRHFVGSPIYWARYGNPSTPLGADGDGEEADGELKLSSEFLWELSADDDCGVLELSGTGLTSLENGIMELEAQMRTMGARLIGQRQNAAARSAMSDQTESDSHEASLLDVVEMVSSTWTRILKMVALWKGSSVTDINGITFQLNRQFTNMSLGPRDLRALDAALGRSLPPEDVFYILSEGGWLSPDTTLEDYVSAVEAYLAAEQYADFPIPPTDGGPVVPITKAANEKGDPVISPPSTRPLQSSVRNPATPTPKNRTPSRPKKPKTTTGSPIR